MGDLNADGELDLLATNHLNQNGSVFAYTWSGDLATAKVEKYVLATGFSAVSTMQGTASPGDAIPFHPDKTLFPKQQKPFILVSADNGNAIYVLVPESMEHGDWKYKKQFIEYIGADVGRIAIGDTDGDGFNEFFVPAYDLGQVVHYKIQRISEAEAIVV